MLVIFDPYFDLHMCIISIQHLRYASTLSRVCWLILGVNWASQDITGARSLRLRHYANGLREVVDFMIYGNAHYLRDGCGC